MAEPPLTRAGKRKPRCPKPWQDRTARLRRMKHQARKVWTLDDWNDYAEARDQRQRHWKLPRFRKSYRLAERAARALRAQRSARMKAYHARKRAEKARQQRLARKAGDR